MFTKLLAPVALILAGAGSAQAVTWLEAGSPAQNAGQYGAWETAIGETPDYTETFEGANFTDGLSMDGVSLGGGLSISAGNATPRIETGAGSIGGSNPIGNKAMEAAEGSTLRYTINFASAVDYFSFYYIDLTGLRIRLLTESTNTPSYTVDGTSASGDSAEFLGIYGNGTPSNKITAVEFRNVGGSAGWAIDNLAWGSYATDPIRPIPLPASALLLMAGLGGLAGFRKKFARRD